MGAREERVRIAIVTETLGGRRITPASLAEATGLAPEDVTSALGALHDLGTVYLRDGAVVAAYPLSLVPTPHRIAIGGVTVYANCAIDALAVPPMVDEAARIASACALCGATIVITMRGTSIPEARPAETAVFHVARDCCAPGPAVLTRCPHIQFFCGPQHAAQCLAAHPEHRGTVFNLAGAAAYANDHFARTIAAVRARRP